MGQLWRIDTATRTIFLLGTFSNNRTDGELSKAILKIQRTALEPEVIGHEIGTAEAEVIGSTDIVSDPCAESMDD